MAVDWLAIKSDYINGGGSYRTLAEKYRVSSSTLMQKAAKEQWAKQKRKQCGEIEAKTLQKAAEKISDTESEIAAIKARLRLKIFQELDRRASGTEVDGIEFRRLVQSYRDMCDIQESSGAPGQEHEDELSQSLRELAKELESDDR